MAPTRDSDLVTGQRSSWSRERRVWRKDTGFPNTIRLTTDPPAPQASLVRFHSSHWQSRKERKKPPDGVSNACPSSSTPPAPTRQRRLFCDPRVCVPGSHHPRGRHPRGLHRARAYALVANSCASVAVGGAPPSRRHFCQHASPASALSTGGPPSMVPPPVPPPQPLPPSPPLPLPRLALLPAVAAAASDWADAAVYAPHPRGGDRARPPNPPPCPLVSPSCPWRVMSTPQLPPAGTLRCRRHERGARSPPPPARVVPPSLPHVGAPSPVRDGRCAVAAGEGGGGGGSSFSLLWWRGCPPPSSLTVAYLAAICGERAALFFGAPTAVAPPTASSSTPCCTSRVRAAKCPLGAWCSPSLAHDVLPRRPGRVARLCRGRPPRVGAVA